MYLKKSKGLRAVSLPDGTILTQADLPARDVKRWVASRKLAVVRGVIYGLLTKEEAADMYNLSTDELNEWVSGLHDFGAEGLKATRIRNSE